MMEKVSLGRRNCQKRLINEPSAAALTAHREDGKSAFGWCLTSVAEHWIYL